MRPIIITILLFLLTGFSVRLGAQGNELPKVAVNDYPRMVVDTPNGTRCVIFTLEQAQKIDNDEDLLNVYKELHKGSDSVIDALLFKVKVSDTIITVLNLKAAELEKINSSQKTLVTELKGIIEVYKQNVALANQQLGLKDDQIKNLEGEVRKQKAWKIAGFSVGVIGVVLAVIAIL